MSAFLWFMLAFWIGGCAGFLVFASLQVSRDSARLSDATWSPLNGDSRTGG